MKGDWSYIDLVRRTYGDRYKFDRRGKFVAPSMGYIRDEMKKNPSNKLNTGNASYQKSILFGRKVI